MILRRSVRLLTVTGPPGVGKTRFALELAAGVSPEFDDAVFVDLAPVGTPGLVLDALAAALNLPDRPDQPPLARLVRFLAGRHLLLMLDNFEHVVKAAADVADVLASCPDVKVLVTSRQPLHLRWEQRYDLAPLALPERAAGGDAGPLARFAATTLFIERARAADPGFVADGRNAAAIVEICRGLDGLPLAIELAAAWVGAVGTEAILSSLRAHRGLLWAGPRDAPERQRTLVAAIAWSYDLLGPSEQTVFRALGAFAGETPLAAIEAVCAGLRIDVLSAVAGLVDKNLLVRVEDGETRFRMLQTIREFALERLELTGEADAVRRRHAAWFLELAQQAARFIWSEHQHLWFSRIERVHDDIRGALRWCLGGGGEETGVLLAAAMHRFWFARGHIREGRRWNELAGSRPRLSPRARALALRNLAFFLVQQGEYERALPLAEQAVALARPLNEPAVMAWILHGLAVVVEAMGDVGRWESLERELLGVARQAGDESLAIRALTGLGAALRVRGETQRARGVLEEALALARPRHDRWLTGVVAGSLGAALLPDDPDQARVLLEESLALSAEIGHRWLTTEHLEAVARVRLALGDVEVAATLLAAADSFRDTFGLVRSPSERAALRETSAAMRDRAGHEAFEAAWARGRAMTLEEAAALALGRSALPRSRRGRPGGLTGREVQIALDIARGLTNRQIATGLGVSLRTVDAHVQNIRNKLGMEKRAQIAAWAAAHIPGSLQA